MRHFFSVLFVIIIGFCATTVHAQWTQWGGPNRNFTVEAPTLSTDWDGKGPKRLWERELGEGYTAISVDDGVLYTMYRKGENDEAVIALDASNGKTLWEYTQEAKKWGNRISQFGPGPHSTPIIVGDRVYAVGVRSELVCLNKKTGKKVWSHHFWEEFGTKPSNRGYTSSPMVYKNMLIIPVGGKGHGVMAFDLKDGQIIWKNQDFINAFSSPIMINVDGQEQLIVFVQELVAGLDPNNGELLWTHPHSTQYQINVSTPVWGEGNLLFTSSAYDAGSRVIRLSQKNGKTSVKELWYNRKMKIHHGTAIRIGDTIYGSSGDFGPAFLTAVNAETGEITAQQRGFAKTNFVLAGSQLIMLDADGVLAIATPTPEKYEIHAKAQIFSGRSWTVPTLVGTTLYLRDRKEIMALDLDS